MPKDNKNNNWPTRKRKTNGTPIHYGDRADRVVTRFARKPPRQRSARFVDSHL
jgi:hypothetical protein